MDYVHYHVYADLGSLTFARLAAHGFSSNPAFPAFAPPLPFTFTLALPDASFHLCRHYTKSAPSVLKKRGMQRYLLLLPVPRSLLKHLPY